MSKRTLGAALLAAGLAAGALAAPPKTLRFQGRLEDPAGLSGVTTVTIRLFDAITSGTQTHVETDVVVLDGTGAFLTTLGDGATLDPWDFHRALWAEVTVDEAGGGTPQSPRLPLLAAPAAVQAHEIRGFLGGHWILGGRGSGTENGAELLAAAAAAAGATTDAPRLIRLGPGVYDLGASTLSLPDHVSLVGSGADTTLVSGTASTVLEVKDTTGPVEIRDLEVRSNADDVLDRALRLESSTVRLRRVEVRALQGGVDAVSIEGCPDVFLDQVQLSQLSSPARVLRLTGSTVRALRSEIRGYVVVQTSSLELERCDVFHSGTKLIESTGGLNGDLLIRHSSIRNTAGDAVSGDFNSLVVEHSLVFGDLTGLEATGAGEPLLLALNALRSSDTITHAVVGSGTVPCYENYFHDTFGLADGQCP